MSQDVNAGDTPKWIRGLIVKFKYVAANATRAD
jgi:hypothetical protein